MQPSVLLVDGCQLDLGQDQLLFRDQVGVDGLQTMVIFLNAEDIASYHVALTYHTSVMWAVDTAAASVM